MQTFPYTVYLNVRCYPVHFVGVKDTCFDNFLSNHGEHFFVSVIRDIKSMIYA